MLQAVTMVDEDEVKRVPVVQNRGGVWVRLGDEEYRIPPLAFRAVVELQDEVAALRDMGARPTPAQMDTVARIVHAAIARNYPAMTVEQVGDMLDLGNYADVLMAVLQVAGFTKGRDGPGEAGTIGTPPTAP